MKKAISEREGEAIASTVCRNTRGREENFEISDAEEAEQHSFFNITGVIQAGHVKKNTFKFN